MLLLVPKGRQCANRATITRTEIAPWQQVMLGGPGARAQGTAWCPQSRVLAVTRGGRWNCWEGGLLGSELQSPARLIFTPHTRAGAALRISPPNPVSHPDVLMQLWGKALIAEIMPRE